MRKQTTETKRNCCYPAGAEKLTERHVQAIWYDRDLRPPRLVTRTGEELRVVHPGEWNLAAGPDFLGATLELGKERRRVKGDVEIHLSPSEWEAHSHGSDPAYANVVAHVTWMCGPDPASLPKGAVSVWIGRFVASQPGFSPEQVDLGAYPFARLPSGDRPCFKRLGGDPDLAHSLMRAAGEHRIAAKARRFSALLAANPGGRMQVFWEETMAALGYKNNSSGFREVARAVPYCVLAAEGEGAPDAVAAAGRFVDWERDATRPGNRPEQRLRAGARLFASGRAAFLAEVASFAPSAVRAMVSILSSRGEMGRGRAGAVIANVVLPFALAESRIDAVPAWLPPEDVSQPVRTIAFRMFGRDHNPCVFYSSNGLYIQGLIQIYRDFCLRRHPFCEECEIGAGADDPELKGGTECWQDATAAL